MRISKFNDYNLLLEKRIGEILSKIEIIFNFEIIKTKHSDDRKERDGYKKISNAELKDFVTYFRREIAEHIITGEIVDQVDFVIKSDSRELCCVLIPDQQSMNHWKLILRTVWRESPDNRFRVGKDQLVIIKP